MCQCEKNSKEKADRERTRNVTEIQTDGATSERAGWCRCRSSQSRWARTLREGSQIPVEKEKGLLSYLTGGGGADGPGEGGRARRRPEEPGWTGGAAGRARGSPRLTRRRVARRPRRLCLKHGGAGGEAHQSGCCGGAQAPRPRRTRCARVRCPRRAAARRLATAEMRHSGVAENQECRPSVRGPKVVPDGRAESRSTPPMRSSQTVPTDSEPGGGGGDQSSRRLVEPGGDGVSPNPEEDSRGRARICAERADLKFAFCPLFLYFIA